MPAPMSKAVMQEWLRSVPLFAALTDSEFDLVAGSSRSTMAKRGTRVFEEGSVADCCYVLTAGRAKLVLSAEGGTEIILGVLNPRDLVGEVALLDGSTRSADLIATEECHFIRIPKETFDALRRNFAFETQVVAHAMSLLRGANDQVRGTAALPSISKVAWCLARMARREGTRRGTSVAVPRRPHQELGEMTGLSRETVTRALSALKRRRCVAWDEQVITLDIEALQRLLRRDLLNE